MPCRLGELNCIRHLKSNILFSPLSTQIGVDRIVLLLSIRNNKLRDIPIHLFKMKGVIFEAAGAEPKVVDTLTKPTPDPGQVLVKSLWTAMNPV